MRIAVVIAVTALVASGCANPVAQYTAQKYWDGAVAAEQRGDWRGARSVWKQVIPRIQVAGATDRQVAIAFYEYGRSSGVICDWPEAERGLTEALEIDKRVKGPVSMSLIELARLNLAQGKYDQAREFFSQALNLFKDMDVETNDPFGYADFLEEYSTSIEKSSHPESTLQHRQRAAQLRATFPKGASHTDITPYGTQCVAP